MQELDEDNCFNTKQLKALAKAVTIAARGYSLNHRSVSVTNDKLKRDTNKLVLTGRSNTVMFAQILTAMRKQLKHRGIVMPKPGTDEFLNYKEASKLASDFCNEYGFTKIAEGYKEYIKLGLPKMTSFSIFKFKNLHAAICKDYEASEVIRTDRYTESTKRAHEIYLDQIRERVGFAKGFEDTPEKYACFVKVSELAREYKVSVGTFIKSQFHGMDWRSTVPDPLQLISTKAIERLQRYCFEFEIKGDNNDGKKQKFNFKQIKKAGK